MNARDIYNELINSGVPAQDAAILVAVGQAESSLNPQAVGDSGNSIGLFQIYMPAHTDFLPVYSGSGNRSDWINWLKDPINNIKAAVAVYNSQGLEAWTMFRNGGYQQYMGLETNVSPSVEGSSGVTRSWGSAKDSPNVTDRIKYWYNYLTGSSTDSPLLFKSWNSSDLYDANNNKLDANGQIIPGSADADLLHQLTGSADLGSFFKNVGMVLIGIALAVTGLFMLSREMNSKEVQPNE